MKAGRCLLLTACLALARVATVAAQTSAADGSKGRAQDTSVEITFVGPKDFCEPLMSAVAPIVGAGDRVSQIEDDAQADVTAARRGRVVVDVATKGRIQIFVFERERRTLVRAIDSSGSSSVTSEIVAQIVRETTNALHAPEPEIEGVPSTTPPALVPPGPAMIVEREPGAEPGEARPGSACRRLTLSLDYARRATIPLGVLHRDAPAEQGVIGTVVFEIPRPHHPFLAVVTGWTGLSLPPVGDSLGSPGLILDRISARALMGLALPLRPVEIRAAAGLGADILRVRAGDTAQGTILLPTLQAMVQGLVALPVAGLVVQGTLTLDVQPKARFTESASDYAPGYDFAWTSRLQPGFMLGIGWQK